MTLFLTVLHVTVCLLLIVVVLLQRGKGADIGAVFGGGGSSTVFGSRGAGNFLTKLTTGAAVVFMVTSLSLAYFAQEGSQGTLFDEDDLPAATEETSPFAEPAPAAEAESGGFEEVEAPAPAAEPEAPTAAPAAGSEAPAAPAAEGEAPQAP